MGSAESHDRIKEGVLDFVSTHLIGPMAGENEILEGRKSPHNCYVTGVLYPMQADQVGEREERPADVLDDDSDIESEGSRSEEIKNEVASDRIVFPSSAGISFRCEKSLENLEIKVSFGMYSLSPAPSGHGECYIRSPFAWTGKINPSASGLVALIDKWVYLSWHVRTEADFRVVSLTLENRVKREFFPTLDPRKNSIFKNIGAIWQIGIEVFSKAPSGLLRVSPEIRNAADDEINSSTLLYRNCHPYAFGHNCSADWTEGPEGVRIWTTFFPRFDLLQMVPAQIEGAEFQIESFADTKAFQEKGLPALRILSKGYSDWIKKCSADLKALPSDVYRRIAEHNLAQCERASQRMDNGIKLLSSAGIAQDCFVRANRIMSLQHDWKKTGRPFKWHPFQIAFFLINLEGLFDETSPDRNIADLLWFPTGGGKTEAYLLMAAFVLLWRRKRNPDKKKWCGGTAIILRYTLRLLTQQQLQRAARMICAAEHLRRADPSAYGQSPISIGLWVGDASFPNENKTWERKRIDGELFMPFSKCPCCNSELGGRNYSMQTVGPMGRSKYGISRIAITCKDDAKCAFHNQPLPIYLSEEDVFRFSPTVIVGTVDKFAQVAWATEAGKLFNKYHFFCAQHGVFHENEARCSCGREQRITCSPPELIIQDELHLITGPLGSMVGAFEVAIRALCSDGPIEPKYITSTATIRGATKQLLELYRKESFQFPPPAVDYDNSYFAIQATAEDKSKVRTYVGLSAQGRSGKLITARLYAALNHYYHHNRKSSEIDLSDLDFFRTVIGYFNSRKELGGVNSMIGDDVLKWRKYQHDIDGSRYSDDVTIDSEELMGGIASDKIMKVLARLEVSGHKSPEFVLATNILSVGIDIDRLVTMVVAGQPKTTSEFIQATSRVGRQRSGIVFVNYNWARARDRSHYEKFRSYHEQLYRFVEGISVTPYSPEARKRTLAGTLVAMLRHDIPQLWGDNGALGFDINHPHVKNVKENYLSNIHDKDVRDEVGREVDIFLQDWWRAANGSSEELRYKSSPSYRGVLAPFGTERDNFLDYFVTSLRNVDEEIPLKLFGGIL